MKTFDREFYIRRNKETAMALYGPRLKPDRTVSGTDIWFDENWAFHHGKMLSGNDFQSAQDLTRRTVL